jgi:chromosome segregation ATPase
VACVSETFIRESRLDRARIRTYIPAMAENIAHLTLERVRRLDEKLDVLVNHVVEVKTGLTLFKQEMATMHAQMAQMYAQMAHTNAQIAHQSQRLDGIETRLSRIERRLDLVETV